MGCGEGYGGLNRWSGVGGQGSLVPGAGRDNESCLVKLEMGEAEFQIRLSLGVGITNKRI